MDFAVVTHAVGHQPMSFQECLTRLKSCGFDHVVLLSSGGGPVIERNSQSSESYIPDLFRSDQDELKRIIEATGVSVTAVTCGFRPDVSSDEAIEKGIEKLVECQKFCVEMGWGLLGVPVPPSAGPLLPHENKRKDILSYARLIDEAGKRAGRGAPKMTVDIHYHSILETVEDCSLFAESLEAPNVGLGLNIGHLTTCEQDGWELIYSYPNRVLSCAWKDHSLAPDRPRPVYSIELGTGDSPFPRYIKALRETGVEAVHVINVEHAPAGEELEVLKRSLQYMKNLWDSDDI